MKAKALKEIIQDHGIKYIFVAKHLGVSLPTVSRWLNGVSDIPERRKNQIIKMIVDMNKNNPIQDFRYPFLTDEEDSKHDTLIVYSTKKRTIKAVDAKDKDLLSSDFIVVEYTDRLLADSFILYMSREFESGKYSFKRVTSKMHSFTLITEVLKECVEASMNNLDK